MIFLSVVSALTVLPGFVTAARSPVQNQPARDVHMTITFNGSAAGEASYHSDANGAFKADTHLAVATTKIVTHLEGHFKGSILHDFVADLDQAGQKAKLELKEGKLSGIDPHGKSQPIPYDPKLSVYFGNLCPQISSSLLDAVVYSKKEVQTIRAFMVDGGAAIPLRVTPLGEKSTSLGVARQYRINVGITTFDYSFSQDGVVVGMDVPGQKLRMVADGWAALYVDPFAKYPELSQATLGVKKASTQHLKTRDGVDLAQDVILPDAPGPFPVVFARTPYDKSAEEASADFYVKRGYAYVSQDVRGRTESGGDFDPMVHELNDGYDSLDWISKQTWCDGNIGMIGASYDGFVQWAAAASGHPALKCIIPQVSPPLDAMTNLPYDHGVFFLYGDIWWGKIVQKGKTDMSSVLSSLPNPKGFATLPLSKTAKSVLGFDVPFYQKWLERTSLKDWGGWNFYDRLKDVTIPALNISGWFDGDEIGTNMNWAKMRELGRTNQWLIYGPWTHFFNTASAIGDTDFGSKGIIDLDTLYIRWFDTWLKHKDVGMDKIPHVQAFVTGINRWLNLTDWPSPSSEARTLYLSSDNEGQSTSHGGSLLPSPVKLQAPSVIVYDPSKAVIPERVMNMDPSKVSTLVTGALKAPGVLVYKTTPFTQPTAITGPFEVDLSFRTSARDTDFFVGLVDIDEKGAARVFGTSGKLRASYIQGYDRPRPLAPGQVYVAKIEPWDSAHELKAGHRLAIMVSCTGFPMFARNLGTGEPIQNATRMIKQRNEILHDAVHPSSVHFRVLWGGE